MSAESIIKVNCDICGKEYLELYDEQSSSDYGWLSHHPRFNNHIPEYDATDNEFAEMRHACDRCIQQAIAVLRLMPLGLDNKTTAPSVANVIGALTEIKTAQDILWEHERKLETRSKPPDPPTGLFIGQVVGIIAHGTDKGKMVFRAEQPVSPTAEIRKSSESPPQPAMSFTGGPILFGPNPGTIWIGEPIGLVAPGQPHAGSIAVRLVDVPVGYRFQVKATEISKPLTFDAGEYIMDRNDVARTHGHAEFIIHHSADYPPDARTQTFILYPGERITITTSELVDLRTKRELI